MSHVYSHQQLVFLGFANETRHVLAMGQEVPWFWLYRDSGTYSISGIQDHTTSSCHLDVLCPLLGVPLLPIDDLLLMVALVYQYFSPHPHRQRTGTLPIRLPIRLQKYPRPEADGRELHLPLVLSKSTLCRYLTCRSMQWMIIEVFGFILVWTSPKRLCNVWRYFIRLRTQVGFGRNVLNKSRCWPGSKDGARRGFNFSRLLQSNAP